ncbi:MAG: alcohol dehydrogenase catalytic domain-containing protein [Ferrovibrio sp.]|uniref:alcohol dehydrogenase catalytic domain-containing protein n=1 Tax=Ferrovibrio sp. TaxID=1917215 RepID=UPI00391BF4EC
MSLLKARSACWQSNGCFSYEEHVLPKPAADEVVVSLAATTVNPIDVRRRDGYGRRLFGLLGAARYPLTLGNDIVGFVSGAPSGGIKGLKEGDRVFGCKPPSSQGAHASKVILKAKHLRHAPKSVPDDILAALPYNTATVLSAFDSLRLPREQWRGKSVLIYGAAGGLGVLATQMLVQWGAKVTAVAWPALHATCRAAGAHSIYDPSQIAQRSDRYDITVNFAAWDIDAEARAKLSLAGIGHTTTVHPLMTILDTEGFIKGAFSIMKMKRAVRRSLPPGRAFSWAIFKPKPGDLEWIGDFAARGIFRPDIGLKARLDAAPTAFHHVAKAVPGRAILMP